MLNSTVLQGAQLGLETTPGTAVAATRRLRLTDFMPEPVVQRRALRRSSQRFRQGYAKGKEMTKGTFEGDMGFHDLIYLLSGYWSKNPPQVWLLTTTNTGSNFTLSFRGQTTGNIAGNATAATILTAVAGLSTVGSGNALVLGSAGSYRVILLSTLAFATEAITGAGSGFTSLALSNGWAPPTLGVWTMATDGDISHTFTLTFRGQVTGSIAGNATAATIQADLEALSTIGTGNVSVVSTGTNTYKVTLIEALAGDLRPLTGSGLTSGPTAPTITNLRRWGFIPKIRQAESPQIYTLEKGYNGGSSQTPFVCLQTMEWRTTEQEASVRGDFFGRTMDDNASMSSSGVTDVAARPIDPGNISLFAGTTLLGLERLATPLDSQWTFGETKKPKMTQNAAVTSFTDYTESAYEPQLVLTYEHGDEALTLLDDMRNGTVVYLAWEATGQAIDTYYTERVRVTGAFEVISAPRGDKSDVYADTITLAAIEDATLGGALRVDIDTTLTGL